ncbi:unnamed protein product [Vitrella brassicaformis CCMP3155]|uniref:Ubiquitin-like domain-containing protein n=1 Tax=Vitrella brassicaformis (strain CCMP3155) TaxID=1169540 RepID=A0A0G4F2I1_VITBC|nr:unnamed protein product [Vitrella brassicaformis CCMP3155]|eukprot:CEM06402.1 unnamed protein product [Vitrella brassicaformis CCMP3155]
MTGCAVGNCLVDLPDSYGTRCFQYPLHTPLPSSFFADTVERLYGIPVESQRLVINGLELSSHPFIQPSLIDQGCSLKVLLRLVGGKGGFGSLLRGQKGRQKKTTNFDACRDLSGRRIRHAQAVKRIKDWLEKKKQDDDLVKALGGGEAAVTKQPHQPQQQQAAPAVGLDGTYIKALKQRAGTMKDIVREGLTEERKRTAELAKKRPQPSGNIKRLWFEDPSLIDDEDAEQDQDTKEEEKAKPASSSLSPPKKMPPTAFKAPPPVPARSAPPTPSVPSKTPDTPIDRPPSVNNAGTSESPLPAIDQLKLTSSPSPTPTPAPDEREGMEIDERKKEEDARWEREAAAIDVSAASGAWESAEGLLEVYHADVIKHKLKQLGLKCGGTPLARAQRLFLLKTTPIDQLPKKLMAKKT